MNFKTNATKWNETLAQEAIEIIRKGQSVPYRIAKLAPEGFLSNVRTAHKLKKQQIQATTSEVAFLLISKNSVSITHGKCDECKYIKPKLGRYHSDRGNVNVCFECKREVFSRSFESSFLDNCQAGGGIGVGKEKFKFH